MRALYTKNILFPSEFMPNRAAMTPTERRQHIVHKANTEYFKTLLCTVETSPYQEIHVELKSELNQKQAAIKESYTRDITNIYRTMEADLERLLGTGEILAENQLAEQRVMQHAVIVEVKKRHESVKDLLLESGLVARGELGRDESSTSCEMGQAAGEQAA